MPVKHPNKLLHKNLEFQSELLFQIYLRVWKLYSYLQVLPNALKLLDVIKLQLQAGRFSSQHTEINTKGQAQWTISC